MFDTQKVPEMRNIGLASIEAVWPQLDQSSIVPHKAPLHAKFQVISSIGGRFMALPVRESVLCFHLLITHINIKLDDSKIEVFSLTLNVSTNSTSNQTTKDRFEICLKLFLVARFVKNITETHTELGSVRFNLPQTDWHGKS